MIEEHIQRIVESNRGNEEALVYRIVREIHLLRAALPTPAYLESVASQLEDTCVHEMDLPDGSTFNGPVFLRHAAELVRLAINEETALANKTPVHKALNESDTTASGEADKPSSSKGRQVRAV